jgi:hypothetical protein
MIHVNHGFAQNVLALMFFSECAISHDLPPEFAVIYVFFSECAANHVSGKKT